MGTKMYVPLTLVKWESVSLPEAPHLRLKTSEPIAGFLQVFTTREAAVKECPGKEIMEIVVT